MYQRSREFWPKCQTMTFLSINSIHSHIPGSLPTSLLTSLSLSSLFILSMCWNISLSFCYTDILWLQFKLPKRVSKAEFNSSFFLIPEKYHLLSWTRYKLKNSTLIFSPSYPDQLSNQLPVVSTLVSFNISLQPQCNFLVKYSLFDNSFKTAIPDSRMVFSIFHIAGRSIYLKCK